jgi:hypothetical protein
LKKEKLTERNGYKLKTAKGIKPINMLLQKLIHFQSTVALTAGG